MPPGSELTANLRSTIQAIISGNHTRQQVNHCVRVCHAVATTVLRRKIVSAMLQARFHYTSYSDMAYDCIADLFSQDEQGVLVKVKAYFEGVNVTGSDDEELLSHLRRLIASKVNQGIFRIYGDVDPVLGKIIRNIKLSIQTLENFAVSTRFGEWQICPTMTEKNEHLPLFESDGLERELCKTVNGSETIPELLSKLSLLLRDQCTHCRSVPLIVVARVFRSIYSQGDTISETTDMADGFIVPDTQALIREVCSAVKKETEPKYVGKKKIHPEVFEQYFSVIEETTAQHLLGEDGDEHTLFEKLKVRRPDLTRKEYYKNHRAVVEYLARVTHERVVERLKKDV